MEVVSAPFSCDPVGVMARCREHPLPPPFFTCVRVLSLQSVRQIDATHARLEILLVLAFHSLQVSEEGLFHYCGKDRVPVLVALSCPNDNLVPGKVDILDSKTTTLHEPQPSAIQKHGHQPRSTLQRGQKPLDFFFCKDDRQAPMFFGANDTFNQSDLSLQHFLIKKQKRVEGLILG